MTHHNSPITLDKLGEHLIANELLAPEAREEFLEAGQRYHAALEQPLMLRIVMGVAAVVVASLLGVFLAATRLFDYDAGVPNLAIGAGFAAMAIVLFRNSECKNSASASQVFLSILSLCLMLIGKFFLVKAGAAFWPYNVGTTAYFTASLVVTLATYHLFASSFDRFISCLVTFILFSAIFVESVKGGGDVTNIALRLWCFLHIAAIAMIFTSARIPVRYYVVGYALVYSLFVLLPGMAMLHVKSSMPGVHLGMDLWRQWDLQLMLGIAVLYTIGWIVGDVRKLWQMPLAAAVVIVALLGVLGTGILLALLLLLLGYARRERGLLVPGLLLLPLFLVQYYYYLDVTLLEKSGVLVGSGVVLLLAWAWLRRYGFDAEEVV